MKDVIHYTRRFIQLPGLSGEEKEIAFFIRDLLNEFGLGKVYIDEIGDVIGFVKGRSLHPLVVLEDHIDHVSPETSSYGNIEIYDITHGLLIWTRHVS
ncbi:hypothetical protein KAU88_00740 [Candidatus Bathyarchaeota archaeon]|nr:hypothetical protein [Candidatus Bathyarchaeota archaeon]